MDIAGGRPLFGSPPQLCASFLGHVDSEKIETDLRSDSGSVTFSLQPGPGPCTSVRLSPLLSDRDNDTCLTRVTVRFSVTVMLCCLASVVCSTYISSTLFESSPVIMFGLSVAAEREDQRALLYLERDWKQSRKPDWWSLWVEAHCSPASQPGNCSLFGDLGNMHWPKTMPFSLSPLSHSMRFNSGPWAT